MTGLIFAHPEWLAPGLATVAVFSVAVVWAIRRSRQSLRTLLGNTAFESAELRRHSRNHALRDVWLIGALLLVLVGLLGPRIGREDVQLSTRGVDVVVLLDTSRSMDARDVPPTRLRGAQRAARALLAALGPGDRAALAVFSGRGVLLTPLTSDRAALDEMIPQIETDLVKPGGSNLAAGVLAALEAFEPVDARPRTIIALTDGETPGFPIGEALVRAVQSDTRVFAAAFGTSDGATIPDHGVPLRDPSGEVVTTRRRVVGLEEITGRTGGQLQLADEWGSLDVPSVVRQIRAPVANAPGEFVAHRVTVPMVVPFAIAATLLLLLEWLARGGVWRLPRPLAATMVAAISIAATPAEVSEPRPAASARSLVRAGLDHAARGSWPRARASFLAAALAAREPDVAALAYYDLGVAALREQDFEAARDAFLDALAAGADAPASERVTRTQWNLEWVLARLAETEPPKPQRPPPPGKPGTSEAPRQETTDGDSLEAEKAPGESQAPPEPTPRLSEQEREKWLGKVADDPRRALLSAAFEPHEDRRRRKLGTPTW